MIKFKRGTTKNWSKLKTPLADGQPGYDRDRHKVKVGDGKTKWDDLPDVSGLHADEIIVKESKAEKDTPFTYGTENPDKDTKGKVYLQYYNSEPEIDYIINCGKDGIWTYQIWKSGRAKCWGTLEAEVTIKDAFDSNGLYCNKEKISSQNYPFSFVDVPVELATVQSDGGITWLGSDKKNTKKKTGVYKLISPDEQDKATYLINLLVEGYMDDWI